MRGLSQLLGILVAKIESALQEHQGGRPPWAWPFCCFIEWIAVNDLLRYILYRQLWTKQQFCCKNILQLRSVHMLIKTDFINIYKVQCLFGLSIYVSSNTCTRTYRLIILQEWRCQSCASIDLKCILSRCIHLLDASIPKDWPSGVRSQHAYSWARVHLRRLLLAFNRLCCMSVQHEACSVYIFRARALT